MLLLSVLAVAIFAGLFKIQQRLDAQRDDILFKIEELAQIPSGRYLKPAVLGYEHVTADFLWLRLLQVVGNRSIKVQDYEWLYHAFDVVTTLDPQYDYAYQVGGVVLTQLGTRVDLSNKLLEKGLEANPLVWQIPFYLGFNHFMYLQDYPRAADYMARASRLPGRPPYLPLLATRLYAQSGDPETALDLLSAIREQTPDGWIGDELEGRIKELMIERDIRGLEHAVAQYRGREGTLPKSVTDLVRAGLIAQIPQEPFGGAYRLDPESGTVNSTTHPERLRVRPRPGA